MCVVEQKTYLEADGNPRLIERIRRCENAVGAGTCSNTRQTFDTIRIIETKPESSSSSRKNEVVTDNNGRTRIYRDLSRRSSRKHKTGHSKRPETRDSADTQRPVPLPAFDVRRASPVSRPDTPNSAPPRMTSFTPENSEPTVRFRSNGTAVYDLPSSRLNMPRAAMNERMNTNGADRRVSFEDDARGQAPNRHHPKVSNNTGAHDSAMPSPTRASPGLSRLPSIRHQRTDSARDLPFRDQIIPDREDKEHAARELARETARRQKAEAEANLRRQEELEAAEDKQLDLEAERARNRRPLFVDPPRRVPESLFSHHDSLDDDDSTWSRHTSPPAPPRLPRPAPAAGARFASASPLPTSRSSLRHSGTHRRTTVHHYHYPDSPTLSNSNNNSRRPSDSIRERGREVIERERVRAAAEDLRRAVEEGADAGDGAGAGVGGGPRRWEPVFDEFEERVSGREYYYVSEGPARQESRRRRGSWRDERKRDFWS